MRRLYRYGGEVLGTVPSLSAGVLRAPTLDAVAAPTEASAPAAAPLPAYASSLSLSPGAFKTSGFESAPVPTFAPQPSARTEPGFFASLAWWQYALGGVGLAAIGYGVYRMVR
jgi:hypothetical protein